MQTLVKSLRSGQITIPLEYRKKLGVGNGTYWQLTLERGEIKLRPVKPHDTASGSVWFGQLYSKFAAVRTEAQEKEYSKTTINKAIDQATTAVRSKHDTSGV